MLKTKNLFNYLLIAQGLIGFIIVFLLFYYSRYGLDFTDEAFYLAHIVYPDDYVFWASLFGNVLNKVFALLDEDILYLRYLAIILIYILSASLIYFLDKKFNIFTYVKNKIFLATLIAPAGFFVYNYFIFTPSYNHLNYISLLFISNFLILILIHKDSIKKYIFSSLLGITSALVLFSKSSSALLLAVIVFIFFIFNFSFKQNLKYFLIIGIGAILGVGLGIFVFTDGIQAFFSQIQTGIEYYRILDDSYASSRLFRSFNVEIFHRINYLALLLVFFVIFILYNKKLLTSIIFILLCCFAILFYYKNKDHLTLIAYILEYLVIFGLLNLFIVCFKERNIKKFVQNYKERILVIFFLFFLPFSYSFGTNNSYFYHMQGSFYFWLLSSILLLSILNSFKNNISIFKDIGLMLIVFFITLFLMRFLISKIDNPYRQISYSTNYVPYEILKDKSKIKLPVDAANYLQNLKKISNKYKTDRNTMLLDLTGGTPVAIFPLNMNSYGLAWTLGGYSGSAKALEFILDNIDSEKIKNAWILVEPNGTRSISPKFLQKYGINFPKNYIKISDLEIPAYSRDLTSSLIKQELYAPKGF